MNTKIIEIDPSKLEEGNLEEEAKIKECSEIIKKGGTVAFPTETVYGLGANGLDPFSIKKIYEAKGRPSDNPLILHVASIDEVKPLVKEIPEVGFKLMKTFWPGPLTLVMEKSEVIPREITAGLDTVAIRMPEHPIARGLIEASGVPIAAPSANRSGKPSPTKAEHVIEDLSARVDAIISGGSSNVGLESTVLDITVEPPVILRPGGITKEMLEQVIAVVSTDPALEKDHQDLVPRSPGMKYTHYAPKADVVIVKGSDEGVIAKINGLVAELTAEGKNAGIISTEETKAQYSGGLVKSIGRRNDVNEIASNLFTILREFDETNVEVIFTEAIEETGLGKAIMNRLLKAAGYRLIEAI
uniref:L-threonylcarbamoyladenylate synthase n=1 Tax=Alkaliphilus transvaalensis TaxID=114628 RepID=UPI00054F2A51